MDKQNAKATKQLKLLLALWPYVTTVLLIVLAFIVYSILNGTNYVKSLDGTFWLTTVLVVTGHLLAFSFIPIVILHRKIKITKEFIPMFVHSAGIVIGLQVMYRVLVELLKHLDCGGECYSTIIPAFPATILCVITLLALLIVFLRFKKIFLSLISHKV